MSKKIKDMASSHASSSHNNSRCGDLKNEYCEYKHSLHHVRIELLKLFTDPTGNVEKIGTLQASVNFLTNEINRVKAEQGKLGCVIEDYQDQSIDLQTILTSAAVRRKDRQALVEIVEDKGSIK